MIFTLENLLKLFQQVIHKSTEILRLVQLRVLLHINKLTEMIKQIIYSTNSHNYIKKINVIYFYKMA